MSKMVNAMTFFCFIYDVNVKHLVMEHELSIGDGLIGKVNFLLAGVLFNLRRDRKYYHANYEMFGSNDIKIFPRFSEI